MCLVSTQSYFLTFLRHFRSSSSLTFAAMDLSTCDPYQADLMKQECIAVDEHDNAIGGKSKLDCHLQSENLPLHRAFSLFLFNTKGELLLQQRASTKITFPDHYTNTCCSHPLFNKVETNQKDNIGVKLAAQRRVEEELGIVKEQFPLDCIKFLAKVHYKAPSGEKWGEHEIDYVLFAQCDVTLDINPNEVSQVRYVSLNGFQDFLAECKENKIPLTPWFELIAAKHLLQWWSDLDNLNKFLNQNEILRLTNGL